MPWFNLHFLNSRTFFIDSKAKAFCNLKSRFAPETGDIVWLPDCKNAFVVKGRWIEFDRQGDPDEIVMTVFVKESELTR